MRISSAARFVSMLALFVAAAMMASCKRSAPDARDGGSRVRIVSLSPSTTEALFAMNAGGLVVGRSRFCDAPPEVTKLPVVGGYTDPNFEAIFALSPSLVVGARGPAGPKLEERLRERNVDTFFPETESIAQIDEMLLGLGKRAGREAESRALVEQNRARIDKVKSAIAGRPRPRVLMLFDVEPVVAAGPKSFPDELLTAAGGNNAVTDGAPYPVLGIERVLALDPDVILDTTVAMDKKTSRVRKEAPGWSKLRAVREGRVIGISDESVLRPGPRIADAVVTIAKVLHDSVRVD